MGPILHHEVIPCGIQTDTSNLCFCRYEDLIKTFNPSGFFQIHLGGDYDEWVASGHVKEDIAAWEKEWQEKLNDPTLRIVCAVNCDCDKSGKPKPSEPVVSTETPVVNKVVSFLEAWNLTAPPVRESSIPDCLKGAEMTEENYEDWKDCV